MYESYLEVDPDRPATSDRSGDVHDGERGDKAAFFILWAGLLMFLLLWAWITIKSCYDLSHQEAPVNNGTAEEVHILSRKERKARLIKYFEDGRHHMELTNDAFREQVGEKEQPAEGESKVEDNEIDYDVESIEQMIRLKIPSDEDERVVSSYCAICLDRYKLGDNIVWSISPNCRHVFHRDCLVDGLTRVKNDNSPCPCCRAKFCDFPSDGHMQAAAASCGS